VRDEIDPEYWIGLEKAAWPAPLLDPKSQSFSPDAHSRSSRLSLPLLSAELCFIERDAMDNAGNWIFYRKAAHSMG
jgi:hypothetical protein